MKIKFTKNKCIVTKEKGDPKYYGVKLAAGESKLLHAIKLKLKEKGFDVIKKRMWKDGHLVDEMQQYIRTKRKVKPSFYIWNSNWNIKGAEEDFNSGEVVLSLDKNIWKDE